jgi:hypothetical protein
LPELRHPFATTLEGKIKDAVVSPIRMAHGHGEVITHISNSYRHLHAIYGIGPTVGLAAPARLRVPPKATSCRHIENNAN